MATVLCADIDYQSRIELGSVDAKINQRKYINHGRFVQRVTPVYDVQNRITGLRADGEQLKM